MRDGRQRLSVDMDRRAGPNRLVLFSFALHIAVLLAFLMVPSTPPAPTGSEPLSVEIVAAAEPAEGTSGSPAAAVVPDGPVEQADIPPPPTPSAAEPTPDMLPPVVQPAEITPPAAAIMSATPVQESEILAAPAAPKPPTPTSMPTPPRRAPVASVQKPAMARRVVGPAAPRPAVGQSSGEPAAAVGGQNAAARGSVASNGAAWMGKLKQWWDQHAFYPKQASQNDEGGAVRLRIVIASDGQIMSVDLVQGSGSAVLDVAALAVFRNAHLPPFPPGTPAPTADVVVTLHYRPSDSGG